MLCDKQYQHGPRCTIRSKMVRFSGRGYSMKKAVLVPVLLFTVMCGVASTQSAPQIVAKVALTGQAAAIPLTTLITFKANPYRVSLYYEMVQTSSDCASSIQPLFQWVDDTHHEKQAEIGPFECFDLASGAISTVVHGIPGTPLQYEVTTNPRDTIDYNIYITVEKLE